LIFTGSTPVSDKLSRRFIVVKEIT
jgi:hypothetical protein